MARTITVGLAAHVDAGKVSLAQELHRRYPPDPQAPRGTWNVLRSGRPEEAEAVLCGPIVLTDVREGNTLLTDLWFEAAALRQFGRADAEALAWAEEHVPPPEHLDFRMLLSGLRQTTGTVFIPTIFMKL